MSNTIVLASSIAIVYFICKFLEMRYVNNESEPLRGVLKDSVMVFVCSLFGIFASEQVLLNKSFTDMLNIGGASIGGTDKKAEAFTDPPDF